MLPFHTVSLQNHRHSANWQIKLNRPLEAVHYLAVEWPQLAGQDLPGLCHHKIIRNIYCNREIFSFGGGASATPSAFGQQQKSSAFTMFRK
jgi:hypothetical protein